MCRVLAALTSEAETWSGDGTGQGGNSSTMSTFLLLFQHGHAYKPSSKRSHILQQYFKYNLARKLMMDGTADPISKPSRSSLGFQIARNDQTKLDPHLGLLFSKKNLSI